MGGGRSTAARGIRRSAPDLHLWVTPGGCGVGCGAGCGAGCGVGVKQSEERRKGGGEEEKKRREKGNWSQWQ